MVSEAESGLDELRFIASAEFSALDLKEAWKGPDLIGDSRGVTPANFESTNLTRLCSEPLLSLAEERHLFCRMNYLKYRANSALEDGNLVQYRDLFRRSQMIRDKIVSANTRLVVYIVKRSPESEDFEELVSVGLACLLRVVERFDYTRGFRLSTYATTAIRRELYRSAQAIRRDKSRFTTVNSEVFERVLGSDGSSVEVAYDAEIRARNIRSMLSVLDERERFIIEARFGFLDLGVKPSLANIGKLLGISKERARQLQSRALSKLRSIGASVTL